MNSESILQGARQYVLESAHLLAELRIVLPELRDHIGSSAPKAASKMQALRTLDRLEELLARAEKAHREAGGGEPY